MANRSRPRPGAASPLRAAGRLEADLDATLAGALELALQITAGDLTLAEQLAHGRLEAVTDERAPRDELAEVLDAAVAVTAGPAADRDANLARLAGALLAFENATTPATTGERGQ